MAEEAHDGEAQHAPEQLAFNTNQQAMAVNAQLLQQHAAQQQHIILQQFWMNAMTEISSINPEQEDFKTHNLPLARIKKIMKSEEEILNDGPGSSNSRFMISAEAPIMFAKACEIFIQELTTRSWGHTEENKRRTLQRNDISVAVSKADTYDFLIDIVPREEIKVNKAGEDGQRPLNAAPVASMQDQQQMLMYQQMQLAQMQQFQNNFSTLPAEQQMQYMQQMMQQQPYAAQQMLMYQQMQMAQMQYMQGQQTQMAEGEQAQGEGPEGGDDHDQMQQQMMLQQQQQQAAMYQQQMGGSA